MSTNNKKLNAEANDLLEDLKKTFGSLFEEYKKKKEDLKNHPDKLDEFLSSSDWRNKFRIGTKNDEQWCKFFDFVRKTYQKVYDDNHLKDGIDREKASEAEKCLKEVETFCHLEKFQEQYKKVFDEWLKLDQQDKENKAGKISVNLDDQWQKLKEQISDIGIGKDLTKIIDMNKIKKTKELENLALENPNFDTMLKFCEQVKKLLDIDLNKYLLRNFDGFVEQFKGIFKEFEEAGYLELDKWPEKSKKNDKNKAKNGKKEKEEKDAEYWKDKIKKAKHNVEKVHVRELTDDEWKDFLWDNRMNFTHEQVRKLGFISDKDGNTDHFTLHRLADFVCFVPKSGWGHDVVHDLRFFSFYMGDSGNWNKEKIEQLFKDNLDINVNKNLQIKDGTPVECLFGYDIELLMKDIDRLGHDKKFDDDYYNKLVNATHDKLVACLCAIDPGNLMDAVLSERGYVPNSAKGVYKKIDSKEKFNNMFGRYTSSSDECCDYKYLYENLYDQIKKDVIGKIESKKERKKVIGEFVDSMSEKIFNFSKRNCESYLKQNKSSENINIEYEANRYALWSFYKIIIEITKKAEKEKEEDEKKEFKRVISNFRNKWLAKCNSVLKIKDNEEISNQQLEEFMKFMYKNENANMYLNKLNRAKSFAERISDDEFEEDAVPSVDLIQNFLYDVFDTSLACLKNSTTNVLEDWKFDCVYKMINKFPGKWLSNRDNLISLLGYIGDNSNAKLLDNKFSGSFTALNTGFGFFGFSKEQKKSILDKIGEIRDECVFYAFISECIVYEGDYTKEVDIETLQMIIEKTEIYGLGLRHYADNEGTIDDRIYDKMKRIVELINQSNLKKDKKKKVFKNISDLYFNKFYYSNGSCSDGELFGVELDRKVFKSPENNPTKADIICKAVKENKIDTDWFCKFLESSITLACDDDKDKSKFYIKEALYADQEDIVDILLDPVKFEFCKKKYQELQPAGTAFNSFDTIENAVKELSSSSCWYYCQEFYNQNKKYFEKVKANVLAGKGLNISEDKKGIIESIKTQVVKHGLWFFISYYGKECACHFISIPADYFWLFDKETQKNLIQKACTEILTEIGGGNKSKDEIHLSDENGNFSELLSLAEQSGNLSIFLENDLAIKLFDKMHDELNDFEFELYQKMIAVDKEDKLLRHLLTSKRISSDEKSKDKRLPIYKLLIANDRQDIKELNKQADDAYNKYSKAYDNWEEKSNKLEEQEEKGKKTKNKDKKNNTKKENKSSKDAAEINKNIEQMKSGVDEADKKQKELYEAYEAIDNKMQIMKKTLTEADKDKLNKIAKDLLAKIKENKGKNGDKHIECLNSAYYFLANLLNKIEITIFIKKKPTNCNFFDLKDLGLEETKLFRDYMLALCAIEKTETEFDKTTIRDLFVEFIGFSGNELLNSIPQKAKIDDETLKQLKVVLNLLNNFYSSAVGVPYKGLSQSQANAVIEIFVDLLDRIKNKDVEAFLKLTENTQLKKLIEDKNCKLGANLVDKIKKLFDNSQEKPKVMTDTTEAKNNVINEDNKQENQNTKKDIDKKDGNDGGDQVINEVKTELKDTENMQFQNPNESNKVNDDNADEKKIESKNPKIIKKELNQLKQEESASSLQNKKNFDSIVNSNQHLSMGVSDRYKTTTGTQNLSTPFDIKMLNKKAESSNTSQKMGYTTPAVSTLISIAAWFIFVFIQAEILLIVSIILTVISAILWGIKFYTEKIKKEEPPTVNSPQKSQEGISINDDLLQQYQDMTKNGKLIKQKQEKQNNEIN